MDKKISKQQYVLIDLIILTAIMCILMWAGKLARDAFPKEIFTISIVMPITLIAMMRHGALGVVTAAVGGLVYCIINGAKADIYLVYIIGNSFIYINILWFKKISKQRIKQNIGLIIMYVISGYVLMNIGRSVLSLIFGYAPFIANTVRYFTTDALSAVMAIVIVLIANKQDGIFEDQMDYLVRLATEEELKNERKA